MEKKENDISDLGDGISKSTVKIQDSNLPCRQAVVKVNIKLSVRLFRNKQQKLYL